MPVTCGIEPNQITTHKIRRAQHQRHLSRLKFLMSDRHQGLLKFARLDQVLVNRVFQTLNLFQYARQNTVLHCKARVHVQDTLTRRNPCAQFRPADGFCQEIIGTRTQPFCNVIGVLFRGQKHKIGVWMTANPADAITQFQPGHTLHDPVTNNDIRGCFAANVPCVLG